MKERLVKVTKKSNRVEHSIEFASADRLASFFLSHTKCKVWWALIGSSIEPSLRWELLRMSLRWASECGALNNRKISSISRYNVHMLLSRPIVGWRFHDNSPARKSVYWDISSEKSACGSEFRHIYSGRSFEDDHVTHERVCNLARLHNWHAGKIHFKTHLWFMSQHNSLH